jgi:kynurenine formamidase
MPSNWGRWGSDDQRGTLNLLTAENVLQAASLVRRGKVYSLAVPLHAQGPLAPGRSPLWHRTTVSARPAPAMSSVDDIVVMHTHGTTHVDALCHVFYDNQMYNGYPVDASITPTRGASKNGVQNIGSIVSRGVLLDVAAQHGVPHLPKGYAIGPTELDACARAQGVEIRSGDVVLVRTGWLGVFDTDPELYNSGSPGPGADVVGWFQEHDLCALGADNTAVEPYPLPPGQPLALHLGVIRDLGGYLLEFVQLDELAADKVYEFLFVAAPLRLVNGIGSPINPLAIC